MTAPTERAHAVWLYEDRVGTLHQRGDHTRFVFEPDYLADPLRPLLGLRFEEGASERYASALRLPPWFSNLLPEGLLRRWIADDRGVSPDREMELLAQVGHDLPGAVRVLPDPSWQDDDTTWHDGVGPVGAFEPEQPWRFSLAGVGLKFSMLAKDDRLTLPAYGEGGDWIVKLPDRQYRNVPLNECTMMSLASVCGIDVPPHRLVHRDELDGLPSGVWPPGEEWAYAVRRFDRRADRRPVHIEDLAQVRDFYPEQKYAGSYETLASLVYRRRHLDDLREFTRRLAFCVLIGNGDAHLKNWSFIYHDPHIPTLAPAYDLLCTAVYHREHTSGPETLGLRWRRRKRMADVTAGSFTRLEQRLSAPDAGLADTAIALVHAAREMWPTHEENLGTFPELRELVRESIDSRARSLMSTG